jgi:hypothetical protein
MTEHRKLKKLIRERMTATGESYTTARRHVLAKAQRPSALPAGLVPGYRTFGAEQHRPSAHLAHVLAAHEVTAPHTGEPYGEAMLAGLGGGIGFMYAVFEYQNIPPLMTIVAQHHPRPWAPAALDHLGIAYTEKHSGKPALTKLRAALADGHPVFVTLDRSRLPWHGLEPGYGQDPYVVVVAGADGDTLYLDDESPTPHALSEEDFGAAWSAHRKGRHHMLTVDGPNAKNELPEAIRGALATTVAHLTGPVLGNNFDVNFGFSGMAKLAGQLRDTRTKTGWARRFGAPVPFYHGVRRLYECIELEYTAPGATRPVYADFLDEAAPLVDARLADAADLIRRSGRKWSELAALALDTTSALGEYTEVAEERMRLIWINSRDTMPEIKALSRRLEELAAAHAAEDGLGDTGRRELFNALADLVEGCLDLERQAVEVISTVI